jgi:hypothetical protein
MAFGLEEVGAEPDTPGNLVLDRFLGKALSLGDFGLGEPFEFVEEEEDTGLGRECRQGIGQEIDLLPLGEDLGDTGPIF